MLPAAVYSDSVVLAYPFGAYTQRYAHNGIDDTPARFWRQNSTNCLQQVDALCRSVFSRRTVPIAPVRAAYSRQVSLTLSGLDCSKSGFGTSGQ